MSTTRDALKGLPRPVRPVTLPGGGSVHVRDLTLAELRAIDARADAGPPGDEQRVRTALLLCAAALADPDGRPAYPEASDADLDELAGLLTTSQIEAVIAAAVPSKERGKNS